MGARPPNRSFIMRTFISILFAATVVLSLAGCKTAPVTQVQGRSVADYVKEVLIVADFSGDKNLALDALVSAGPQVMPELANVLLHSPSAEEQAQAAFAMGAIAYRNQESSLVHDTVPALIQAAQSSDVLVRIYSVQALGAIGKAAKKSTPTLLQLTKDESGSVRMCALEALSRIGVNSPEFKAAASAGLYDSSDDVRYSARRALAKLQADGR
jgi:HEAT repeat protein